MIVGEGNQVQDGDTEGEHAEVPAARDDGNDRPDREPRGVLRSEVGEEVEDPVEVSE